MEIFSSMHLSNRKKEKKKKKNSSMLQKIGRFMLGSRLKEGIEA